MGEALNIARVGKLSELADELLRHRRDFTIRDSSLTEADVQNIIDYVRTYGDKSLLELTLRYDHVDLTSKGLRVTASEVKNAYDSAAPEEVKALKFLYERIYRVESRRLERLRYLYEDEFVEIDNTIRPISSVGCYVPGGMASYPSTLIMTAAPARVAGVERIIVCSPPMADGNVSPFVLIASDICGVDEVYRIGGVQAIAAMGFGTETIKPVDKIVGPGNAFVTLAKLLISRNVSIDMPAGPTEILIFADESADSRLVALDLISQAEHAPDAKSILVTTSIKFLRDVEYKITALLSRAERRELAEYSLRSQGALLLAESVDEAVGFINAFAPEHLELILERPMEVADRIYSAGIILVGDGTPVSVSDYCLGTDHVLPTSGYARTYSGLSVLDFVKRVPVVRCRRESLRSLLPIVRILSNLERLPNHYKAVEGRFNGVE
jgi:histidinol dehydrogenase